MTFTFTWDIDHHKLDNLLREFLMQHNKELTEIVGKCFKVVTEEPEPIQQHGLNAAVIPKQPDHKVDNRPIIGDTIPEDPFSSMFDNPNNKTTRYRDRNH